MHVRLFLCVTNVTSFSIIYSRLFARMHEGYRSLARMYKGTVDDILRDSFGIDGVFADSSRWESVSLSVENIGVVTGQHWQIGRRAALSCRCCRCDRRGWITAAEGAEVCVSFQEVMQMIASDLQLKDCRIQKQEEKMNIWQNR